MNKVVKIQGSRGQCTGEQVVAASGENYILTAGHCKGTAEDDGTYRIVTERGGVHYVKAIDEDGSADLLLLEGVPGIEGLKVADSEKRGQHIITFTHGSGLDTYRTDGTVIQTMTVPIPIFNVEDEASQALCASKLKYIQIDTICALMTPMVFTTAFISPGSSGGPVVNSSGELIGVVSAGGRGYSLLVRLYDIKEFLDKH